MFLIPDNILENLKCSICQKYLNVSPVKIYSNRNILCGRCEDNSAGNDGATSLYNYIAGQILFPCINRYEGCSNLVSCTKMLDHEKECLGGSYNCPICQNSSCMSAFEFLNHFKINHEDHIMYKPELIIKNLKSICKDYLLVKGNLLLLIQVTLLHIRENVRILVNVKQIRSTFKHVTVKLSLDVCNNNGIIIPKNRTANNVCPLLNESSNIISLAFKNVPIASNLIHIKMDVNTENVDKFFKIPTEMFFNGSNFSGRKLFLNHNFYSKYFHELSNTEYSLIISNREVGTCCFCHDRFFRMSDSEKIFQCECDDCKIKNNLLCNNCFTFGIKQCPYEGFYEFAVNETDLLRSLEYYCRWNCGEHRLSWDLHSHEISCGYQKETICPLDNCSWQGTGLALNHHLKYMHKNIALDNNIFSVHQLQREKFPNSQVVIPVYDHFFILKWGLQDNKIFIRVTPSKKSSENLSALIIAKENNSENIKAYLNLCCIEKVYTTIMVILR